MGEERAAEHADQQVVEVAAWLQGADARSAAGAELDRLGLRGEDLVDDVLAEVALNVVRRLRRLGPLDPRPDGTPGVVAYCRRAVRNAAIDLVRGPRHLSIEDVVAEGPVHPDGSVDEVDLPTTADPVVGLVEVLAEEAFAAALRRALFLSIQPRRAWSWSAALALVALARNPASSPRPDTPEPDASAAGQRLAWAALHHAGRHDCFTDQGGSPDAACRMRRTRSLRQVSEVLQAAALQVTGDAVGGDVEARS